MKALILAAGRGSRMKDLTIDKPKCLVELQNKPLLNWQLDAFGEAGITDIGIITGYKRELLSGRGLTEFFNPRWEKTNMVSSLDCAREWLMTGPTIVSYSDIYYHASAVRLLQVGAGELAITYDPNWLRQWSARFDNPLDDAETFRINAYGQLVEIGSKPKAIAEVQGQYMGLLRFTPSSWREVINLRERVTQQEQDQMHMTETLQKIIEAKKIPVKAFAYNGKWGEIDSENDLMVAEKNILSARPRV